MVAPKDLDLCIRCTHIGEPSFCIIQTMQRITMGHIEIIQDCAGYSCKQSAELVKGIEFISNTGFFQ